ncbi:hypothetical protein Tco_0824974 [Tanacetum coccineum]
MGSPSPPQPNPDHVLPSPKHESPFNGLNNQAPLGTGFRDLRLNACSGSGLNHSPGCLFMHDPPEASSPLLHRADISHRSANLLSSLHDLVPEAEYRVLPIVWRNYAGYDKSITLELPTPLATLHLSYMWTNE